MSDKIIECPHDKEKEVLLQIQDYPTAVKNGGKRIVLQSDPICLESSLGHCKIYSCEYQMNKLSN